MPLHRPRGSSLAALAAVGLSLTLCTPAFAGDPLTSIEVNEVESSGLADFIELANVSGTSTDVGGLVLKDSDDASSLVLAEDTPDIPAGGFLAVDTDVPGGFGLGQPDAARVYMPGGLTLVDSYSWTLHAPATYGRCPDGTGAFTYARTVTKGAANDCPAIVPQPWPGGQTVTTVDTAGFFGDDLSGLDYEGTGTRTPGVLWAVDNGSSALHRLLWNGAGWAPDPAGGWAAGKALRFPGGAGRVDSEGVTLTGAGAAGGVFVSSERNLDAPGTSRVSVLRYDVSGAAATLDATQEWNLTPDIPPVGNNAGAESVEWVSDSYLVGEGFVDQATGEPYDPVDYPSHGTGIFLVGLEANGQVYAYALDQTSGGFTRVATFASGFLTFGALHFDPDENRLWVVCDNNCDGRSRIFEIDDQGAFAVVADHSRPTGMGNFNNEGFTIAPDSECVGGSKPVYWADDGNDAGHALRRGTIDCTPAPPPIGSAGWSAPTAVKGDFDGDGFGDLAAGVDENGGAGAVHVLPGSAAGVTATGSQLWSQDSIGIADAEEAGDGFGRSLAVGNFNGDGFADLAIGAPGEDGGAGVVHVLYGSASGLTATGSQTWSQGSTGIGDDPEAGDHFGATLAAGNADGTSAASELAVGAPDEDVGAVADAGVVHVLRGSTAKLTATGSQVWGQSSAGVADNAEAGDRFGSSLAIGNLGGTAHADLAVGVPEEDGTSAVDHGAVHVLLGSATGVVSAGSSLWTQNSAGVGDSAEAGDGFGGSLVIANVLGSATADLVVGAPGEDVGAGENAGMVQTIPGDAAGPKGTGSQTFTQNTVGIADASESGDEFGSALAAADFGGDAYNDVAAGVPGESGANQHYGVVQLIPGSAAGLTATGSRLWSQNSAGVGDTAEAGDRFGAALAAADYGGTVQGDLAVGAPGESVGAAGAAGLVQVLPGSGAFLTGTGSKTFSQNTAGVADTAEAGDALGASLGR